MSDVGTGEPFWVSLLNSMLFPHLVVNATPSCIQPVLNLNVMVWEFTNFHLSCGSSASPFRSVNVPVVVIVPDKWMYWVTSCV